MCDVSVLRIHTHHMRPQCLSIDLSIYLSFDAISDVEYNENYT